MHVTMVKKRLANGEPCNKCMQAEELLRTRGFWNQINEVVWALEDEPDSPGMRLARLHGVEVAPFFIVAEHGMERVYESVLRLIREALSPIDTTMVSGSGEALSPADELAQLGRQWAEREPVKIVRFGLERFGKDCTIAFSGAEDVALIDMAAKSGLQFSVFTLDTGRLHPETYRFIDRVREHYAIEIDVLFPDALRVEELVRKKGLFSFYRDGHEECCKIRKVEPLRRLLGNYRAWMTGQRRDQSPATRHSVEAIELDMTHTGPDGPIVKINPLARWSSQQVFTYLRDNGVPYNELHDRNYRSIGCEPCTGMIESRARTTTEIIVELRKTNVPERAGRAQDQEDTYAMEKLRREGYM